MNLDNVKIFSREVTLEVNVYRDETYDFEWPLDDLAVSLKLLERGSAIKLQFNRRLCLYLVALGVAQFSGTALRDDYCPGENFEEFLNFVGQPRSGDWH